ncbi:uncharacterized protein LOC111403621 isoform X1 [Olea europaea var. sylvestris]|uniref:uncharacterized protein LOC111403621 isoform X1 n=1 Tax=Olea europaea var. sylvestris TaxID=158386 RepID=UPI000C1D8C7C|nr:uncharacterized protein LOC111403621 isoform X1 [Olea europaea var. sylvestris]
MPDSPTELYNLFTSKEPKCMEFKKISRGYNNHFAFTSFGVKCDTDLFRAYKGIYTFRIQGQVYHYVNQLLPENNQPSYMQLYFYDTNNEVENRMKISENFVESTLIILIEILKVNPYSRFFRSLSNMTNLHDHRIQIRCDPGLDQRVFNTPSVSQVATVWVEDDDNANIRVRDITIYGHSGESHKVHYYYGCYDPLQYPLLFPFGEPGWHEGIQRYQKTYFETQNLLDCIAFPSTVNFATEIIAKEAQVFNGMRKRSQVSCREYYSYKLQIRPSSFIIGNEKFFLILCYMCTMESLMTTSITTCVCKRFCNPTAKGEIHLKYT